jgi:hypothetical protein
MAKHPDHQKLKAELLEQIKKQGEAAGLPKDVIQAASKRKRGKRERPTQATFNSEPTAE